MPPRDDENYEDRLRRIMREEIERGWALTPAEISGGVDAATVGAVLASVPFSNFTFTLDPAANLTYDPAASEVDTNVVQHVDGYSISTGTTTSDPTVTVTTGTYTRPLQRGETQQWAPPWVDSPSPINAGPWVSPQPESPFNEPFERRLRETLGITRQDVDLPDDVEMLKCCQIGEVHEKDVTLEFKIKGPTIPKKLIAALPPEMFKILDLEIKRAMIRAFQLTPTTELRKRTIIVDDEE